MASVKLPSAPQDNTGSTLLAQYPPRISLDSPLLASAISLQEFPLIAYAVFSGGSSTGTDNLIYIEHARRRVLARNTGRDILSSLLPAVHISRDTAALFVFAFGSYDQTSEGQSSLAALQHEDLVRVESSTFQPSSVYPCSAACSTQEIPCPQCLDTMHTPSPTSSAHLLPRRALRLPFHYFLSAVRDRLIDDITKASTCDRSHRPAVRYKDGFLLSPSPASSEWSGNWEHPTPLRPMIYSSLKVQLSHCDFHAQLLIHTVLSPTFYLPLNGLSSLPSGTPIVLLPYGVPAYYLNTYSGPTSALTSQFQDALLGLGVGDWVGDGHPPAHRNGSGPAVGKEAPTYVIAWLSVQNKQGEDKGMPIVWPLRLCLSYHPTSPSPHSHTPLSHIPELPTQLQASPPPMPSVPAMFASGKGEAASSATHSRGGTPLQGVEAPREQGLPLATIFRRPAVHRSSATLDSLRAFQGMTLIPTPSTRSLHTVVGQVSGYVDAVAKERERERERMKREKENANTRAWTSSFGRVPTSSTSPRSAIPNTQPPPIDAGPELDVEPTVTIEASTYPNEDSPMEQDAEPLFASSQDSSTDSLFSPADEGSPLPADNAEHTTADGASGLDPENAVPQPPPSEPHTEAPQDGIAAFDPFASFADGVGGWVGPSSGDFMGVDMSLGTSYDMGTFDNSRSGAIVGDFDMDDSLGVFTDEDFNFFDAPSSQTRITAPLMTTSIDNAMKAGEGLTPTAGPAPLGFSPQRLRDATTSSGPGPPFSGRSPWPPALVIDEVASRLFNPFSDPISPAPELVPPSPTRSTSTQSAPATPSVQIADTQENVRHTDRYLGVGPNIFDPIPFAPGHRITDGKYAFGKFALYSPSETEDRAEDASLSWMLKYNAATDPRIGMMKKLIGAKRKDRGHARGGATPTWLHEHEEWERTGSPPVADDDTKSDSESDGDSDGDVAADDEDNNSMTLRPSTPPPSYLPLGPTLLETRFHHDRLLPLSGPLRPPGAAVSSAASGSVPVSAPTPVSPAAVLGATSEKSKSLEAAVQILVKEIVENSIWADAWRANVAASSKSLKPPYDVWQTDAKRVARLLQCDKACHSPVDIARYYQPVSAQSDTISLYPLEPPLLTIAKSDTLIQVLPASLRFWKKLGLGPRAGRKDVTAFVFYEGTCDRRESEMCQWLSKLSSAYSAKNYGTHLPGTAATCSKAGLVSVQFESFKKTLVKFVAGLPTSTDTAYVLYIVTPPAVIALESPLLRQLFSAVKRCIKTYPDLRVLFHFVPEALPAGALADPRFPHEGLDAFVDVVYDRLLQPVERPVSKQLASHTGPTRAYFQSPAFSLAAALPSRRDMDAVSFASETQPSSLDLVNRHMLFHVGYAITPCKRWLLAASVDGRGDSHDLGAWLLPDESVDAFIAKQVWTFARTCAARASVEWRVVVTKLGSLGVTELEAWIQHLAGVVVNSSEAPPMRVMLLSVEHQRPLTFLAPPNDGRPSPAHHPTTVSASRSPSRGSLVHVFADVTSTTYALFPPARVSCYPASSLDPMTGVSPGSSDLPFIPDAEDAGSPAHEQPAIRGLARSMLINAPADTDYTSIGSIEIIQLHTACSRTSTSRVRHDEDDAAMVVDDAQRVLPQDVEDAAMLRDVTHNYHALAVLAQARWQPRESYGLPLHLSALEAMIMALTGGPVDAT